MEDQSEDKTALDPPKLLRIASLVKEVLEELRLEQPVPGESPSMESPSEIYTKVVKELKTAMPESLFAELDSIDLDLGLDQKATKEEVRIAYSGLIGWLSGLFQGLQAASAQAVLAEARTQALIQGAEEPDPKEISPQKEGYL
ncbi:MAG: proteasome activator [Actinomycetota bacterium]|nr:bacterial proteasome activator family protein [Actinomycetota bacterium]